MTQPWNPPTKDKLDLKLGVETIEKFESFMYTLDAKENRDKLKDTQNTQVPESVRELLKMIEEKGTEENPGFLLYAQYLQDSLDKLASLATVIAEGGNSESQEAYKNLETQVKNFNNYIDTNYPNAKALLQMYGSFRRPLTLDEGQAQFRRKKLQDPKLKNNQDIQDGTVIVSAAGVVLTNVAAAATVVVAAEAVVFAAAFVA
ncbi:hypothetical protein [Saccharopolyspora rosea]|uniref:Uncharacterized protein n=1 Tax=Saccharopolyspora rosea TaxID=524884 RepID=A0ABW3FPL1_9PSEU|nr:hypothetical protein [Saccharopolyspora rosea]